MEAKKSTILSRIREYFLAHYGITRKTIDGWLFPQFNHNPILYLEGDRKLLILNQPLYGKIFQVLYTNVLNYGENELNELEFLEFILSENKTTKAVERPSRKQRKKNKQAQKEVKAKKADHELCEQVPSEHLSYGPHPD